ncbi:MAG: helix-turn-helix domain-containing protein [Gammaproteobacteria bacterium]|nr:helix-turn-helix domain-containing protein [Gammaproteobacteria bacterium]
MLSKHDVDQLQQVTVQALQCEDFDAITTDLIEPLVKTLEASSSVFIRIDPSTRRPMTHNAGGCGVRYEDLVCYCDYYHTIDPLYTALLDRRDSRAEATGHNVVRDRGEYLRSRFYNEFLVPQSIHHMVQYYTYNRFGQPTSVFGFFRPKGDVPFSSKNLVKGDLLSSALSITIERVAASQCVKERDWIINSLCTEMPALGVIILNGRAQPSFVSDNLPHLLGWHEAGSDRYNALQRLPREILEFCRRIGPGDALRDPKAAIGGMETTVTEHGHRVVFTVAPMTTDAGERRFMIRIRRDDEGRNRTQAGESILTPRQIEIASLLRVGMSNMQIAAELGISIRTVQNHLRLIYEKVNVHNRTALVHELFS